MKKDKFDAAEEAGRSKFQKFFDKILVKKGYDSLEFSKKKYSAIDAIVKNSTENKTILVEIKNRSKKFKQFQDVFAEEDKLKRMEKVRQAYAKKDPDGTVRSCYFNSYTDDNEVRFIMPDKAIPTTSKTMYCNTTTAVSGGKKLKRVNIFTKFRSFFL